MPAMYTHYVFGQDVLYQLSDKKVKEIIAHYPKMFDIGLFGPDLLYYYGIPRKSNLHHLGFWLHRQEAAVFFCNAKDILLKEKRSAGLAYMFGMICHFVLDGKCHDYMEPFLQKKGFRHVAMEMDLEQELLKRDCRNIDHTWPVFIRVSRKEAELIARFFDGLTETEILISLKHMQSLIKWSKFSKQHKKYEVTTMGLLGCYDEAIPIACELLEQYYLYVLGRKNLSPSFFRTYGAGKIT